MTTKLEEFRRAIDDRQDELRHVAHQLAAEGSRLRARGAALRVCVIILGALTTTQGSLEQLYFLDADLLKLYYLGGGIAIAAIAGIEGAFKFESRGAHLNSLAASCLSMVRQADSVWYKQVAVPDGNEQKEAGALQVIDFQQGKLDEVQEKAANLGLDIVRAAGEAEAHAYNWIQSATPHGYADARFLRPAT